MRASFPIVQLLLQSEKIFVRARDKDSSHAEHIHAIRVAFIIADGMVDGGTKAGDIQCAVCLAEEVAIEARTFPFQVQWLLLPVF